LVKYVIRLQTQFHKGRSLSYSAKAFRSANRIGESQKEPESPYCLWKKDWKERKSKTLAKKGPAQTPKRKKGEALQKNFNTLKLGGVIAATEPDTRETKERKAGEKVRHFGKTPPFVSKKHHAAGTKKKGHTPPFSLYTRIHPPVHQAKSLRKREKHRPADGTPRSKATAISEAGSRTSNRELRQKKDGDRKGRHSHLRVIGLRDWSNKE